MALIKYFCLLLETLLKKMQSRKSNFANTINDPNVDDEISEHPYEGHPRFGHKLESIQYLKGVEWVDFKSTFLEKKKTNVTIKKLIF